MQTTKLHQQQQQQQCRRRWCYPLLTTYVLGYFVVNEYAVVRSYRNVWTIIGAEKRLNCLMHKCHDPIQCDCALRGAHCTTLNLFLIVIIRVPLIGRTSYVWYLFVCCHTSHSLRRRKEEENSKKCAYTLIGFTLYFCSERSLYNWNCNYICRSYLMCSRHTQHALTERMHHKIQTSKSDAMTHSKLNYWKRLWFGRGCNNA